MASRRRGQVKPSLPTTATDDTSTTLSSSTTYPASDSTSTATSASAQSSTTTPPSSTASPSTASSSNAGTIAGCVVGGVLFLVLVVLATLLYLRARRRRRTPPSSEFINALRAGAVPVLRLESGAEYSPTPPEKGGGHTCYPPTVPAPFAKNSYYPASPMQNATPPRKSSEIKLEPQRYSSQANDVSVYPRTSAGSRRELWGSETEILSNESSQSPIRVDSVLHFAPRVSLDEPPLQPLRLSHSPTSLQPLRRQPE